MVLESGLEELAQIVDRLVPEGKTQFQRGPVWVCRSYAPTVPAPALYIPMLCVVATGAKELLLGDERHVYAAGRFLLNSVAVPASGGVLEASPARPCLWTMLELDPALIASVVMGAGHSPSLEAAPMSTLGLGALQTTILDPLLRLVRLLESPEDFEFLAPLAMREIVYRLLQTDQAPRLHQIVASGGRTGRVLRAVEWLRDNYARPMAIDDLARECGLSPSALHHNFKDVTEMSPLRYQKQLRLQEARRLMVGEGLDAAAAGHRVGYDDASHFSREYRRFFGAPPRRDAKRIQGDGVTS
ncbi:AraC family transcriptional regulator [bacterium]|nr:MAG: AraC family transcriptional regulator [bacterium]